LVLGVNIRGTFDILWTYLFTLLICCWTVQHLNIPIQQNYRPGVRAWIERTFVSLWPKAKWMLLSLIVPEFLVGKAFQDLRLAKSSVGAMRKFADKAGFEWTSDWTVTHGSYADMGGFALKARSLVNE